MWPEPRAQQRPEPFQRIDMDFMKSIAIFVTRIFTLRVIDRFVRVAPLRQPAIDIVLICVQLATRFHCTCNDRLNRCLLNIGQHLNDHLAVALKQAKDGWFLLGQCPAPTRAFQSATTAFSPEFSHNFRMTLVPSHDIHFVGFNRAAQFDRLFLSTTPARNCAVICWVSPDAKSNSAAICALDKFRPIRYRHNTQTFRG
jgi:hypothetical protein